MKYIIDMPEKLYNIIQGWDDKTLNWSEKLLKTAIQFPICEHDKQKVLDKIRAKIKTMKGDIETIADVLAIIDKYRAEPEDKG